MQMTFLNQLPFGEHQCSKERLRTELRLTVVPRTRLKGLKRLGDPTQEQKLTAKIEGTFHLAGRNKST